MLDTSRVWENAIVTLANPEKKWLHHDARLVLGALKREWARRSLNGIDSSEYFSWPTTNAPGGDGSMLGGDWPEVGILRFLGYRVGKIEGRPQRERHMILAEMFALDLPPAFAPYYLFQWGKPNSAARLRKMAEAIAAFARNAKRRNDGSLAQAISEWETDLEFLYRRYYVGKFHFDFPTTNLH